MKKKLILSLILVLALMCQGAGVLATVGGSDDPLITKSYADSDYPGIVLDTPLKNLSDSMTALRYKLTVATTFANSVKPDAISAKSGDTLTAYAGSSFTVLSGSMKLKSLTGTLIDVSDGTTPAAGQSLSAGHRYVCAELSVASLSVSSAARVGTLGNVVKTAGVARSFADVRDSDWFYSDVYYAADKGLINGKSETVFDPNGTLTYSEAIKLAACIHQLYNTGSISLKNADAPNKWYAGYVEYARNNGLISSSFTGFETVISRSDFIAIFYAAMPESEYAVKNSVADGKIPDVSMSAKNAKQIYAFYRAGILVGADASGNAYPDRGLMRSEVAAVINRMYEVSARKSITL